MQHNLRYWEYYDMTDTFTKLFEESKDGKSFDRLYEIIISRNNILLAYRTIKSNKGSKTPGTDGRTIDYLKRLSDDEIVTLVQKVLERYRPKKVRRVIIDKPDGGKRPLGIPCIVDRLIQQCFRQVLEPICDAKFYNHNYGFRPNRSTHHALARMQSLVNINKLHYAVDIDIKGFFDNVNHSLLMKQMWNIGIRDRRVLAIIMKMLKAEIHGEGYPSKGTPQGGIISPLLFNIVLNDLDQWVYSQWEGFESKHRYYGITDKYRALRKSNLKEGFIVRYADDFKIMCRDWKSAQKWFHAVRLYLKDRLKLDINPDKSKIVNLRKNKTEFLGFTIRAVQKGKKAVAQTGIKPKKVKQINNRIRQLILDLQRAPEEHNAVKYNSVVLGVHSYFKVATQVNSEFLKIAYDLSKRLYNRLRRVSVYGKPVNPLPTYLKFYSKNYKTYKIGRLHLYPLADVKKRDNLNFNQNITIFTEEGRKKLSKELKANIKFQIQHMLTHGIANQRSVEYADNRISRYSMIEGKCEVTGIFLTHDMVHCHHKIPYSVSKDDSFNNLVIVHNLVHKLIHATSLETIDKYMNLLNLNSKQLKKLNQLREICGLELVTSN
ncbi:group II intron reverse transcriptase/maturase [Metabacillus fastidiosus]|uniref:Group II intron reverse transcriptase/maturase n=1 Tax=Metabacillus fastidiosus TaxID=1458 RepID=A0ABU6NT73_9BACI|nr:group II intron reverse transcriptase/maturase [Metabacillus fastidiosus]MED4400304.1 group II intron reverse transcriptase/maturase [Metabacillus fastidiosus]